MTGLRACFVAPNAYPAIDPRVPGVFGGVETRSWLFARGLARRPNVDVDFIVRHWQPLRQREYDGVRLHLWRDRLYPMRDSVLSRIERHQRFPWISVRDWTPALLWQIPLLAVARILRGGTPDPLRPKPLFTEQTADVFVTFGVQSNSATVIASAHATNRPAVLFLGSDGDLDPRVKAGSDFVSPYRDRGDVCQWLIEEADLILAQTPRQRTLLQQHFDRDATVIANPIDVEAWDAALQHAPLPADTSLPERFALWIGRAEGEHKRPQLCVELAQRCPEIPFVMVLNPRDDLLEAQIHQTAPPNVTIIPRVPPDQIAALYRRARLLVNTSSLEGFPNTYLQAALSSVPVASLVVEKLFLETSRAGLCAEGDFERCVQQVQELWKRPDPAAGSTARRYVIDHHGLDAQCAKLAEVLRSVV